jgi:uroporphyrinogen-III synthase
MRPLRLPEWSLAAITLAMSRQSRVHILLTRPKAQSDRFAMGLGDVTISPLMAPEFIDVPRPVGEFAAVIFTSETAVLAASPDLPKTAFCVGARTAAAAQAAGFAVQMAQGDWRDLCDLILAARPLGRLIFLHAAEAKPDLAATLNAAGIKTISRVVYRQRKQPLTEQAAALLQGKEAVIVPLFSARSARLFCDAYRGVGGLARVWFVALSPQVADAVTLQAQVLVAPRPDSGEMREMVLGLARALQEP